MKEPGGTKSLLADAELAVRMGDLDEAERLYRTLAGRRPPATVRARVDAGRGHVAFARDDLTRAIRFLERARAGCHGPLLADVVETLGRAYAMTGRFDASIELFEEALARVERAGDRPAAKRFRLLLVNALVDGGRFSDAELRLAPLVAEASRGDALEQARTQWTQSRLRTLQGEHELAARHAWRVIELLETSEDLHYRSRACQMVAHVELARGRPDEALELIDRAEALLGPSGGPFDRGKLVLERARVKLATGDRREAAALAQAAAAILAGVDAHDRGRAYLLLADVFAQAGERPRAIEIYELAEELLADAPSSFMVEALQRHAELLEHEQPPDEAIRLLRQALALQQSWREAPGPDRGRRGDRNGPSRLR